MNTATELEKSATAPEVPQPKTKRAPAKKSGRAKTPRSKKLAGKSNADRCNKKAEVIALMKRTKGPTLAEIIAATKWQAHYADVRIMPTCVGNPACGAGIAAMKSA